MKVLKPFIDVKKPIFISSIEQWKKISSMLEIMGYAWPGDVGKPTKWRPYSLKGDFSQFYLYCNCKKNIYHSTGLSKWDYNIGMNHESK